jgi:hypothetical protein
MLQVREAGWSFPKYEITPLTALPLGSDPEHLYP